MRKERTLGNSGATLTAQLPTARAKLVLMSRTIRHFIRRNANTPTGSGTERVGYLQV